MQLHIPVAGGLRCAKAAWVVREGSSLNSAKVGELGLNQVVVALEDRRLPGGLVRVRIGPARWVSKVSGTGELVLAPDTGVQFVPPEKDGPPGRHALPPPHRHMFSPAGSEP